MIRRFLDWLIGPATPEAPYRAVLKRGPASDGVGEAIALDCGHYLRLVHHHRATFPCEQCLTEEISKRLPLGEK